MHIYIYIGLLQCIFCRYIYTPTNMYTSWLSANLTIPSEVRPFLALAVKCQGQLHWRPPDNNQRRSTHPQSSPELQHGTRRCPEGMWPNPKDFTISKGFLVTASKLWNSSTKYDNGTEIISSVDSLMSQNYNKTNNHSLKFGVQALCLKSHPNVIANLVTSL